MEELKTLLETVIKQQSKQQEQLDVLNRRLMAMEESIRLNTYASTQTLTHTKRIKPYVDKAMSALHRAFNMVTNGILNLREETSEFAGTILDTSCDTNYSNVRSV